MNFIKPKEVTLTSQDNEEITYIISKFDAESGREIITQYPTTGAPKIGDYAQNKELCRKLMKFVARVSNDNQIVLETPDLIRNHVPDWEVLARLETAMFEYNCSFFQNGKTSTFFETIEQKAKLLITEMLTHFSEQSSNREKQPSTNSEPSTH